MSIILLYCSENQQNNIGKTLVRNITLSDLTDKYKFAIDYNCQNHNKISFFNKSKTCINAGDIFQFRIDVPLYVKDIKLLNTHRDKIASLCFFKMYINDKLIGKFKVDEKVLINKKVSSIRVLFLKTNNEYIVEGWKTSTIFKFIKQQNHQKHPFSPQIDISVSNKQKLSLKASRLRQPGDAKALRLNLIFAEKHFSNNQLTISGLHYKKKKPKTIQYNIKLNKNGSFRIYQLVSNNVSKKIIREFFINGNWQCTEIRSDHAKLEFEGKLTGYFPDKETQLIHGEYIKVKSILNGKVLQSDNLLDEIYFDFPDDALVNVKSLIPDLRVNMAYAGGNNFTGERLYPCNKCFLRYEVARALNKVQLILDKKQMNLKLFDCYRPFSVQSIMFKKFPVPGYVADTIGGSVHNRGSAVDLTIIDKNGKALDMGTEFDELSIKSNHRYLNFPDTILKNRIFLKELMLSCNFLPIRSEWWHYNYINARKFPKINDEFICN
ncbi:MAG: M15 family metallopeptidase [Bacteroidota bacterium]